MKGLGALLLVVALSIDPLQNERSVNRFCPLKPAVRATSAISVVYEGKRIAFCCTDCRDEWNRNPEDFRTRVREDADQPLEPRGFDSVKDALENARHAKRPAAILFAGADEGTKALIRSLSHPSAEAAVDQVSYCKVTFLNASVDAKAMGVAGPGSFVLVESLDGTLHVLSCLQKASPEELVKEIAMAVEKVGKKPR